MPSAGGVVEAEPRGVQCLTREGGDTGAPFAAAADGAAGARAVDRVADQRVSAIRQMDADLMRPAGREPAFDERRLAAKGAQDAVARHRRLAPASGDDRHLLAVGGAAADVAGDLAGGGRGD